MNLKGIDDPEFAIELRDLVERIVDRKVNSLRPRSRVAVVEGIEYETTADPGSAPPPEGYETGARKATVRYVDEPLADPVTVTLPAGMIPAGVGQRVRIEGTRGDRYVAAVLTGAAVLAPDVPIPPTLPDDDLPPAVPSGLTVEKGPGIALLTWDANTEVDMAGGLGWYELQASTDPSDFLPLYFRNLSSATSAVVPDIAQGAVLSFRLRAIDANAEVSPWSSTVTATFDVQITETMIADDSISTPKLMANSVIAGKIAAGSVTTAKLDANAVTADKLAAIEISVGKYIRSNGYSIGSGWIIDATGFAEFNNVTVRGDIIADVFMTTSDFTLEGGIEIATGRHNELIFHTPGPLESDPSRLFSSWDGIGVARWITLEGPGDFTENCALTLGHILGTTNTSYAEMYTWGGYMLFKSELGSVFFETSNTGHTVVNGVSLNKKPFAIFGASSPVAITSGVVTGVLGASTPTTVHKMPPDWTDVLYPAEGPDSVYCLTSGIPGYYVRQLGWYRIYMMIDWTPGAYNASIGYLDASGDHNIWSGTADGGLTTRIPCNAIVLFDDLSDFFRPRFLQASGSNKNVQVQQIVFEFLSL